MNIVLLGKPGAGKGTLCSEFLEREDVIHVSTGEIFRREIAMGSELGKIADSYISKGNLVPDEITNEIIYDLLSKNTKASYLFDGYPRTINQAENLTELDKVLGINLDAVIYLDIDDDIVVKRLMSRRVCKNCGETFNVISKKPKIDGICDKCGSKLSIRDDDNEAAIRERLNVYNRQTEPLIEYYNKLGILMKLNSNMGTQDLYEVIKQKLNEKKSLSSQNL